MRGWCGAATSVGCQGRAGASQEGASAPEGTAGEAALSQGSHLPACRCIMARDARLGEKQQQFSVASA